MCLGGGGGGGQAAQARADEQARQRRVAAAQDAINRAFGIDSHELASVNNSQGVTGGLFGGLKRAMVNGLVGTPNSATNSANSIEAHKQAAARQAQLDALQQSTNDLLSNQLDTQDAAARRNLKFNSARNGLSGGSVQTDQGKLLRDRFNKAALDISNRAQAQADNLRAQDEQTRQNLLAQAQAGVSLANGLQSANRSLRSNLANANANAQNLTLGDVFSQLAFANQQGNFNAGRTQGFNAGFRQFRPGLSSPRSFSGTVSKN